MEVILLKDVPGIGKKGMIVNVSTGYASNYLIPRNLAVMKTEKSLQILAKEKKDTRIAEEKRLETAKDNAKKLEQIVVEVKARAGKDGKIYGTVSTKTIEELLLKNFAITIDKRKFIDYQPINTLGHTRIQIELAKGVIGTINVHVIEDKKE